MSAVYAAARTRVFIALVEMLRVQASPHRIEAVRVVIEERPPLFSAMLRRHDELVDAIAAHDSARARAIKQVDIEEFRELFNEVAARRTNSQRAPQRPEHSGERPPRVSLDHPPRIKA